MYLLTSFKAYLILILKDYPYSHYFLRLLETKQLLEGFFLSPEIGFWILVLHSLILISFSFRVTVITFFIASSQVLSSDSTCTLELSSKPLILVHQFLLSSFFKGPFFVVAQVAPHRMTWSLVHFWDFVTFSKNSLFYNSCFPISFYFWDLHHYYSDNFINQSFLLDRSCQLIAF